MPTKLPSVNKAIEDIVEAFQKGQVAVFCGAGISMRTPTNLPRSSDIRKKIFYCLCNENPDQFKISNETKARIINGGVEVGERDGEKVYEKNYMFEHMIATINDNATIIDYLAKLFSSGKPNKNHEFLAYMVQRGLLRDIMTTNFDTKIEDAFEALNSKEISRAVKVKLREAYDEEHFRSYPMLEVEPTIYKIHGSVKDKNSIRTTLDLISSNVLTEVRTRVIKSFFGDSRRCVLVVGYSCSDEFDVNISLKGVKNRTKIIFVRHSRDDRFVKPLTGVFSGFKGYKLRINTDSLFDELWKELVDYSIDSNDGDRVWDKPLDEWSSSLNEGIRLFTLGRLLYDVHDNSVEEIWRLAVGAYQKLGNQRDVAATLQNLASLKWNNGDYNEAENLSKKSMEIKEKLGDQKGIAISLHHLAMIKQLKGDYDEAEELYNKSKEIKEKLGDEKGIAYTLHQLAMIKHHIGDYNEAEELYNKSVEIKEKLGDQKGITTTLYQLAMLKQDIDDYDGAEELYNKSKEIKEKLGDEKGIAYTLCQLAMIKQNRGDYNEAERFYKRSKEILKKLEDQKGFAILLHNIATIKHIRGSYNEAEKLYNESMEIFKNLGDQYDTATILHHLAMIKRDKGDYDEAEELYNKSVEIFEKLENQKSIANISNSLGLLYEKKGDLKKALNYIKKAHAIYQKMGMKKQMVSSKKDIKRIKEKN